MIERISLKNFQRHRKLEVEFDERVTTLVGPTDSGKSAILRALRWVCLNRPSGDEMIRHHAKLAGVRIEIDGKEVVRRKGDNENTYYLNDQKLAAFGSNVPEPIADFLNVSELNFQGQLEPHFWLSLSPGQVAKELNAVADLSKIDVALARIASRLKAAGKACDVHRAILAQMRNRKRALARSLAADKSLRRIEALEERKRALNDECERLESIIGQIRVVRQAPSHRPINLKPAAALAKRLSDLEADIVDMSELLEKIESTRRKLWSAKKETSASLKELQAVPLCPTCGNPLL